jgi:hypothetical protein
MSTQHEIREVVSIRRGSRRYDLDNGRLGSKEIQMGDEVSQ